MYTIILYVFALTIIASFIQRVTGFGFGIFVMMFFPHFLPTYGESTTLSGLLAGSTALLIAIQNWRYIRWKLMSSVLFFNVIVSYIAIEYMTALSNETLKRCFGAMLILIAIYFLFFDGKNKVSFKSPIAQSCIGTISGIMGGMFAMPGPPVVLYCVNAINDKREYIATLQAFSVIFNLFYTFFRLKVGFFSISTLPLWGFGLIGVLIGSWIGARCFHLISNNCLKQSVYLLMIICGVVTLF